MVDPLGAAQATGSVLSRVWNWATFEVRVTLRVRRVMGRAGYLVDARTLRRILTYPGFAERLAASTGTDPDLGKQLARAIRAPHNEDADAQRKLIATLLVAYRRRLRGSTPVLEFQAARGEAQTDLILRTIEDHGADDALFESRLEKLHPLRQLDFRYLQVDWPRASHVLGMLDTAPDRTELLARWADYPSHTFADAPPTVFGLLAEIAADIPMSAKAKKLADRFIALGLDVGLQPRSYWMYRRLGLRDIHDRESAAEFLVGVRGDPLIEAALHVDGVERAIISLESWMPQTQREELHRRILLVDLYLGHLRVDDALEMARATYAEFDSTGAALQAARALVSRHMMDSSFTHPDDLANALLLAVQARAKRRKWGLDTGPALAMEIRIRRALSDQQGALDLAMGYGESSASVDELRHPEVIVEAAITHAQRGDVEVAKRLVGEVPESHRLRIRALVAEREDRDVDATALWALAIESADDFGEKADFALQLAFHGEVSPFISELKVSNPGIAREIELTADLFGNKPGALEVFRGFANANYRGTLFLFVYFRQVDDPAAACAVAREGARRWNSADLWVESAKHFLDSGQIPEAISDIQGALAAASANWGGRAGAFRLLVESYSRSGDWSEARNAAAQLVVNEPGNPSATWALVICQLQLHEISGALQSWREHGSPDPHNEMQVQAWIHLLREFGEEVGSPRDALQISTRFADNEPIRRALIAAIFTRHAPAVEDDGDGRDAAAPARESSSDPGALESDEDELNPDRVAVRELLAGYLRDFPDGPIWQVAVDPDDPLKSIQEFIGEAPNTAELDEQFADGALPIGLAGEVHGRTYLESLMARDVGPVFAGSTSIDTEAAAIALAHDSGVVMDLSTLVSLALLPEEIRPHLIGHFFSSRVLVEQQNDAVAGAQAIRTDQGMSIGPGRGGAPVQVHRRTSSELARRRGIAETVVESFAAFSHTSHSALKAMSPLAEAALDRPFLLGADLALVDQVPLWADDRPLRELVRAEGGQAFGTPEVLEHMRGEGVLDQGIIDVAEATLLAAGYTGIRYRDATWGLAESLADTPDGLLNALRWAGNDDINGRAQFALNLTEAHSHDPLMLAKVIHALGQWLRNIASDEKSAIQVLSTLSRDLLSRRWMSSLTLPYCVDAFGGISSPPDAKRVILGAVYELFEDLARSSDERSAALVVFELVSRLDAHDGLRVRGAILARHFE